LEDAKAHGIKMERDKDLGTYIDPKEGKRTFENVWEQWLNTGTVELSTYKNYESVYRNHFGPMFGNLPIASITKSMIADWEQDQSSRGYKEYGIKTRHNLLSSVFLYAVNAEIIGRNPCKNANPRKTSGGSAYEPVSEEDIPETEQVLGVIAELPKMLRLSAWLMAGSGLRPGESLAVSENSITRDPGILIVNHQVSAYGICQITGSRRGIKKGTKHRKISQSRKTVIPDVVMEALDGHAESFNIWGDEGWYFESPRQEGRHPSYDWLLRQFNDASARAGVPHLTPKSLRHYFVSQCLHANIPPFEIAQWVGHRDTRTTEQVYGHLVSRSYSRGGDAVGDRLIGGLSALQGVTPPLELVALDGGEEEAA
jgi:integrase